MTPHPPSSLGHPPPKGPKGEDYITRELVPSPEGRGWTAAGAFSSRRGPGEGVIKPLARQRLARSRMTALYLGVLLVLGSALTVSAQQKMIRAHAAAVEGQPAARLNDLPLDGATIACLRKALGSRDYPQAEKILIDTIHAHPKSSKLLTFLGGIYFLDGSYLECAVAMKKAEAIAPLNEPDRFTLAMAYVVLNHSDWAQPEMERLARADPQNPLYDYWLSRIAYNGNHFDDGVAEAKKAIQTDPGFMRAYDNLGLCYEALGRYNPAIQSYSRAIALNRQGKSPSPWPPMDLGALLVKLDRLEEARSSIEEALRYDPRFPEAHLQMGVLLEKRGKRADAVRQLKEAAALNPSYAEPHYLLGRVYEHMGKPQQAQAEFAAFRKLKQSDQPRLLRSHAK